VTSAVLDAVAYDAASRCLVLYFDSGHVYRYGDVPPAAYEHLLRPGTDRYFNRSIRNKFRMERVQEPRRGR
jgi:hypothetical protein